MDDAEVLTAAFRASLETVIARLYDLWRKARNSSKMPTVETKLQNALVQLLLISPDMASVEATIREAEKYGFDGELLRQAKDRFESVRRTTSEKRSAKRSHDDRTPGIKRKRVGIYKKRSSSAAKRKPHGKGSRRTSSGRARSGRASGRSSSRRR